MYEDAIKLQKDIARKVIARDDFGKIKRVCGVDIAYDGDTAYCSAVVMEKGEVVLESIDHKTTVSHPYVPGLLMLREAEPILQTVKLLKSYDLLLVDGHGLLHPRKCGLACYVGVTLDKPTIGVAKSRLCGNVRQDGYLEFRGEILGFMFGKKMYVSVGHRVSLETAIAIVKELGTEPLSLADVNSKVQKRKNG
jgi:deoxyribonuclease V